RFIAFEAKATIKEKRFDLSNIKPHQYKWLLQAEQMGAICFILLEFSKEHSIFLVPFALIKEYMKAAENGGPKSIKREVFDERAYLVTPTNRALVDYLYYVDKLEWPSIS
ncbi:MULTISPECIES: Holliday junction resolvase RecU, partial [Bacillus cereus group]